MSLHILQNSPVDPMEVFTGAILSPGPYVWHPWDARENSSNDLLKYELQAQSYYKIKQMFFNSV